MPRILIALLMWSAASLAAPAFLRAEDSPTDTLKERLNQVADQVGGIQERLATDESDIANLKKVKVTGYIQARYEYHDDGVSTPKKGNESDQSGLLNRFYVRRGRAKVTYQANPNALGVVYIDASASGVSLKEAYVNLIEPKTGLGFTLGQFNWLFGYEISFSSSKREFPERAQWSLRLFPGERDRGLKVERAFLISNKYNLSLQAEICNGNGTSDSKFGANDPNKAKDFVGRAAFGLGQLDFGVSGYVGKQFNPTDSATNVSSQRPSTTDKIRYGADAQFFYELPKLGGGVLKGELVTAKEPKDQSKPFKTGTKTRNVLGFDAVWAQNLGEKFQWISRIDYYDPDRATARDQKIIYGLGLVYFWDGNSKVKLVYEIPKTATKDVKDNIMTLEWVYAF
jgi:hypothetical protein